MATTGFFLIDAIINIGESWSTTTTGTVAQVAKMPKVSVVDPHAAIIKPGQVNNPKYINGIPYYDVLFQYTDEGGRKKSVVGSITKEDFDALNVSSVAIPANFAGLEAEMVPTRLMDQLFRIVEVVENEDYVEVTARHVWYDNLKNYTLWEATKDTDYSAGAVCRNVLTNALSPAVSNVATDCTDTKKGAEFDYKNKNLVEIFLDPENGICAKFGLNLIRYNWDFYCLKEVGYNRGFVVQNGKNLLGVERTESIENLVTRCAPIAKDKSGNIIWLDNNGLKYVDSQYIDDYSCPHIEIYDTGLKVGEGDVTENNVQEKLLQKAQERFSVDHVDLPEVEMTIEFLSLGDTEEYAQYRGLDKVYLYDIITIHDTVRGYDYTAQVVGVEHDILTGMLTSVTIGKLNNWDGTRKIATWQVPEVNGENIRLKSILAGAFAPGAIGSEDLQDAIIKYAHFASATIDTLDANAITAVTAKIHEIIAGSITADDITAGSITADRIASHSITADQIHGETITASEIAAGTITSAKIGTGEIKAINIDANAIEADKIKAGAITASKIDTNDITAINATLGTANIADARIAIADIDYAHIKDLSASSAYFGQAIFDEAVGGKLYVPRLAVGYAALVGATVGDLVIQASNGNYYGLDVDLNGNVTATQRTVTAGEIASGHTTDGRTLVLGTDILAEDLNTNNIYASHALMAEINADVINVDQLFAREATIGHINALDLSSNTYIRSVVGDWVSGSTITQTVNSIYTRITSLGYGTFFYSETEPSHEDLVAGDVWIKPLDANTWGDIAEMTWRDVSTMTWDDVLGKYEMYAWTGQRWKLLYDSRISADLQTQINQNAYAITLKADESVVDTLSGQVSEFSATLEVQAEEISLAVSSVNAKSSTYIQLTDPSLDSSIVLNEGDTWTKAFGNGTWRGVSNYTWRQIKDHEWGDLAGAKTYQWDGNQWIPTGDRGLLVHNSTQITQTAEAIKLEAEQREILNNELVSLSSQVSITASEIKSEVTRAQIAEDTKISKTTILQTADQIVTEAVKQSASSASGLYIAKTTMYQTAESIVTEAVAEANATAGQSYIAKTSTYQTADSIVTEAVRQASSSAGSNYIAKTSTYQTADSIKNEAVRVAGVNASSLYIAKSGSYTNVDAIIGRAETLAENAATSAKNASIAKTSSYQSAQAIVNSAVAAAQTSAQASYIAKTTTYQTADSIKSEAVRIAGENAEEAFIAKSAEYETVSDIIGQAETLADNAATTAKNASIAKTSTYTSAQAIVNSAVASSSVNLAPEFRTDTKYNVGNIVSYGKYIYRFKQTHNAGAWNGAHVDQINSTAAYIAQTSSYQTADAIVNEAKSYVDGELDSYSTTTQTSTMISSYVGSHAYGKISGIEITADGISISGSQYVEIASGGYFRVTSGEFGIKSDAGTNEYVIWSGSSTQSSAPFRLKPDGTVYITQLMVLNESGEEEPVNLRIAGLWKLNYNTVKSHTETSITLSNGDVVNFNTAASVDFYTESPWTSGAKTITLTNDKSTTVYIPTPSASDWQSTNYIASSKSLGVRLSLGGTTLLGLVGAGDAYNAGWGDAVGSSSLANDTVTATFASDTVGTLTTKTYTAFANAYWSASESMIYRGVEWFRGISATATIGWTEG